MPDFDFNPITGQLDLVTTTAEIQAVGDARYLKLDASNDPVTDDLRGTDFISTRSVIITRDANGYISIIAKTGGRTLVVTRNADNYITSVTDTANTWTLNRDANNLLTGVAVT